MTRGSRVRLLHRLKIDDINSILIEKIDENNFEYIFLNYEFPKLDDINRFF
jgi:hypothetical protein